MAELLVIVLALYAAVAAIKPFVKLRGMRIDRRICPNCRSSLMCEETSCEYDMIGGEMVLMFRCGICHRLSRWAFGTPRPVLEEGQEGS